MNSETLLAYADRIEADLRGNILPFWIEHVVDHEGRGFHGQLDREGKVEAVEERGALLSSRILWTYAAAFLEHGDPAHRSMADFACEDLLQRFADPEHGGFYWTVTPHGAPARTRKQVYGQAFAIYALATYHRATGHAGALETAISTFRLLETHARDRSRGGYIEAFSRDWTGIDDYRLSAVDLDAPKSQNTHLHVMEAYTALLRVWPAEDLREAQKALLEVMLDRVLDPSSRHLGLFFSLAWEPLTDTISYGHDIEAAWLLTEAAEVLGDAALLARVRKLAVTIAEETQRLAIDADGGLFYEGNPREGVTNDRKEWWPQAEALVGFLNAYQLSGQPKHLETALRLWDFIEQHLIDQEHGEWHRAVDRAGKVLIEEPKVSFWKCPYHNGRTGLEAPARLRLLARGRRR